jgi:hypothetical protein
MARVHVALASIAVALLPQEASVHLIPRAPLPAIVHGGTMLSEPLVVHEWGAITTPHEAIGTRARPSISHRIVFRHSFATALAPLIGGDAKTGAKILGHSPQTFMRYVRADDDTARGAIEKMVDGLPPAGQPLTAPATVSSLRVVTGGKSSK